MLEPRTAELYQGLLKNHLAPTFDNVDLGDIREADVRRWRKERLDTGRRQARPFGPVAVAKAWNKARAAVGQDELHFHDCADVSFMLTSARSPCSEAVNARKLSA